MWKRRYRQRLKWVAVAVTVMIIAMTMIFLAGSQAKVQGTPVIKAQETVRWENDPLDVSEYTKVKVGITPERMYLVDECTALVMSTSRGRSYTIQRGLEGTYEGMPDTFDISYDLLENFKVNIKMVKVEEVNDQVYRAKVIAERENELFGIEAKPSDALAFGVRFGAPIYVYTGLLKEYGEKVC